MRPTILNRAEFPPVEWAGDAAPFNAPNFIPGHPHNLPNPAQRPRRPSQNLIGGSVGAIPAVAPAAAVTEAHRYAQIISLQFPVAVVSALFLLAPIGVRNFVLLRNASAAGNIWIDFNQAATQNSPILLGVGQTILLDTVVPQDDLWAISDVGGSVLSVGYSTISPGT